MLGNRSSDVFLCMLGGSNLTSFPVKLQVDHRDTADASIRTPHAAAAFLRPARRELATQARW